jgi:hypothetical protein
MLFRINIFKDNLLVVDKWMDIEDDDGIDTIVIKMMEKVSITNVSALVVGNERTITYNSRS